MKPRSVLWLALSLSLAPLLPAAFVLTPEQGANLPSGVNAAYDLYRRGLLPEAARAFAQQAEAGEPAAMFALASLHQSGEGVGSIDLEKAEQWYRRAIAKGHAASEYNLALMLLQDGARSAEGLKLLNEAATKGAGKALLTLGKLHLEGRLPGGPDGVAAQKNLEQALEAGEAEAAFQLGRLFDQGVGTVAKDATKARTYLERAAAADVVPALIYFGEIYQTERAPGGKADLTKAIDFLTRAGDRGDSSAWLRLGDLFENGRAGQKADPAKALSYYEKARAANEPAAHNKLGYFYENGLGVTKDEAKAAQHYRAGAEAGVPVAQYNYAVVLREGRGVTKNEGEAIEWLRKAGLRQFGPAATDLAQRYRKGDGVPKDPVAALAWMQRAAAADWLPALLDAATMLETGESGVTDFGNAILLLRRATQLGSLEGQYRLAVFAETGRGGQADPATAYALFTGLSKVELTPEQAKTDNGKRAAELKKVATEKAAALKPKLTPEQLKQAEDLLAGKKEEPAKADAPAKPAAKKTK